MNFSPALPRARRAQILKIHIYSDLVEQIYQDMNFQNFSPALPRASRARMLLCVASHVCVFVCVCVCVCVSSLAACKPGEDASICQLSFDKDGWICELYPRFLKTYAAVLIAGKLSKVRM